MTTYEVLQEATANGIELTVQGSKLRWRCRGSLPDSIRDLLIEYKPELLKLLHQQNSSPCPKCGKPRDQKGRCWKCCDRDCLVCHRSTGSAFIQTCIPCGLTLKDN